MPSRLVPIGNFFFRHRNWAFPLVLGTLFALAVPPAEVFGSEALKHVKDCLAVAIAAAGLVVRALVIGRDHVRRAGQNKAVHASRLYTEGMFSLCRNPLYLGNLLIVSGIFLMHGNPWTLAGGLVSYVFIYRAIVAAEEAYLGATFGSDYDDYRAAVPRWLPDLSRLGHAAGGRSLNMRRVLLVEYPNIGVTVLALAMTEFYEEFEAPDAAGRVTRLSIFGAIMAAAVLWVVVIRVLKKRRWIVAG